MHLKKDIELSKAYLANNNITKEVILFIISTLEKIDTSAVVVCITFGDGKFSSIGSVLLSNSEDTFSSEEDVVISVAKYFFNLFSSYIGERVSYVKSTGCNVDHDNVKTKFCSSCGVVIENLVTYDNFISWLETIPEMRSFNYPVNHEDWLVEPNCEFSNSSVIDYVITDGTIAEKAMNLFHNNIKE